jgi:hypothetical protein
MKHINVRVYSYKELDQHQRDTIKIKQWCVEYLQDFYELASQATIDHWMERLKTMGFEDANPIYKGFYYQGSGACFTAYHKHGRIVTPYGGTFPDAMYFEPHCFDWGDPMISGEKQEKILHFAKCQARKIYDDLTDDYEGIFNNDEFIGNVFDNNNIMFTAKGTPFIMENDIEAGTEMYIG